MITQRTINRSSERALLAPVYYDRKQVLQEIHKYFSEHTTLIGVETKAARLEAAIYRQLKSDFGYGAKFTTNMANLSVFRAVAAWSWNNRLSPGIHGKELTQIVARHYVDVSGHVIIDPDFSPWEFDHVTQEVKDATLQGLLNSDHLTFAAAWSEMLKVLADLEPHEVIEGVVLHELGLNVWTHTDGYGYRERAYTAMDVPLTVRLYHYFIRDDDLPYQLMHEAVADTKKVSGVYVYSYNLLEKDDFTPILYKVGRSKDVHARMRSQAKEASKTVQIGELVPLRFYPTSNPAFFEEKLHTKLTEAGAHRKSQGSGNEWFETTLYDIDMMALGTGLMVTDPRLIEVYQENLPRSRPWSFHLTE